METALYGEMAELEETHWWFRGRRSVIMDTVKRFCGTGRGLLLDIGLGTGLNAAYFEKLGFAVEGVETAEEAVKLAAQRAPNVRVHQTSFPSPGLAKGSYDTVTMFDVLEHIEDDREALRDVARILKRDGLVFITVPAFQFLWSPHDELAHHWRRYRRGELQSLLEGAGLQPVFLSYYNFFLFPAIAAVRLVTTLFGLDKKESDFSATPPFLNGMLTLLFGSERWLLRVTPLPVGVSLIAVARKP